jgi:hypothetical protein
MGLAPGIYEASVVVLVGVDIIDTFDLRFEVEPAVFAIGVDPEGNHVFDEIEVGEIPSPHWISITNSGNINIDELNINISGENHESFRLSRASIVNLQRIVLPWIRDEVFINSAYLVVTPHLNLGEGTHSATITISGADTPPYSFDVSITVVDSGMVTVNKTALRAAIATALALEEENYTTASWAVLRAALAEARGVYANQEATQEEVDEALRVLLNAIANLVLVEVNEVDRSVLRATIAAALALVEANYTPASWAVFASALEAARGVYANQGATQAEIDEALRVLQNAMANLILIGDGEDPPVPSRPPTIIRAPATGDDAVTVRWIVLLIVSGLAVASTVYLKRRKSL